MPNEKTVQKKYCPTKYIKVKQKEAWAAEFIQTLTDKLEKEGKSKKGYYTTKIIDDNTCHVNSNIITINTEVLVNNNHENNHDNNHENNQNNHENNENKDDELLIPDVFEEEDFD